MVKILETYKLLVLLLDQEFPQKTALALDSGTGSGDTGGLLHSTLPRPAY